MARVDKKRIQPTHGLADEQRRSKPQPLDHRHHIGDIHLS
jgi:hypothetical protein